MFPSVWHRILDTYYKILKYEYNLLVKFSPVCSLVLHARHCQMPGLHPKILLNIFARWFLQLGFVCGEFSQLLNGCP